MNVENARFAPEAVFERYADLVYRLCFVRTKNRHDSDDILQEVFLRSMKVWKKVESEEHAKALLIRITVNCTKSLLSSAWFRKTEPLDETLPANQPEDSAVLPAVLARPLKYRTVVHLHYYPGYSVEETARLLQTNPSTVKTRLQRARGMLKTMIKAEDL